MAEKAESSSAEFPRLSVYPALRGFLEDLQPQFPNRRMLLAAECFYRLCDVLDLLARASTGHLQGSDLRRAVLQHLRSFKALYGEDRLLPKEHFNVHLRDMLERHGALFSCFVHERRRKELKRYATHANQLTSMTSGSEEHVMELALEKNFQSLEEYTENESPYSPEMLCHDGAGRICNLVEVELDGGVCTGEGGSTQNSSKQTPEPLPPFRCHPYTFMPIKGGRTDRPVEKSYPYARPFDPKLEQFSCSAPTFAMSPFGHSDAPPLARCTVQADFAQGLDGRFVFSQRGLQLSGRGFVTADKGGFGGADH